MQSATANMTTAPGAGFRRPARGLASVALVLVLARATQAAEGGGLFRVRGLGGAGGMYVPSVSPYDANLMFIACDMGGSYRSQDGGETWELLHFQQMNNNRASAFPAFFPDRMFWNRGAELRVSRDRGVTWAGTAEASPWGGAAISQLTALPGVPDALLVSAANGLWRSEDDGRSFSRVLEEPTQGLVALPGKQFAFTGRNTLQTSRDSGRTWTASQPEAFGSREVFGFTGGADDGGTVLFASAWETGILRSRDEGKTWQVVVDTYNDQRLLQMARGQTSVVYAAQNGGSWCREAWVSADGGDNWAPCFRMGGSAGNVEQSWVQTELRWSYHITANGFSASLADPRLALLSTQGDFYITRDGGRSWKQRMNAVVGVQPGDPGIRYRCTGLEVTSCWGYYFDPFDKAREYIAYTDIGFGRSVDNGRTWIWSAAGSPWKNTFYNIAFDPAVPGRIYAACSSRHDIPHWTHITPNDPKARSHAGGVSLSTDGAVTWKPLGKGLPNRPCTDICLDPESPVDARVLYATVFGEGVFKSSDGGQNWTLKKKDLGRAGNLHAYRIRRHPQSGSLYCLVTARREGARAFPVPGGLWMSDDGGEQWRDLTGGIDLAWPTAFQVDAKDERRILLAAATAPGNSQGGIYRTVDGGERWTHILTDADVATSGGASYDHFMSVAVAPDDPKLLYAGTNTHGLWFSRDGGEDWSHYDAFPFANVQSITFHPDKPAEIYLTTFGAGVWVGPRLPPAKDRGSDR